MDLKAIRTHARQSLRGNWGLAILASIIASVFGVSTGNGSFNFNFSSSDLENTESPELEAFLEEITLFLEENLPIVLTFVGVFAAVGFIMSLVMFFLGSIISVGYQKFNLNLVDGNRVEIGTLFSYFKNWKNLLVANIYVNVYIFLWSLLCVIPGIVASYKYAMVPYILAEKPHLTAQEALSQSSMLMQGNKWDLFKLQLSFIGWILLSLLSCGIGYFWLIPYMNASYAEFYRRISGTRKSFVAEYSVEEQ